MGMSSSSDSFVSAKRSRQSLAAHVRTQSSPSESSLQLRCLQRLIVLLVWLQVLERWRLEAQLRQLEVQPQLLQRWRLEAQPRTMLALLCVRLAPLHYRVAAAHATVPVSTSTHLCRAGAKAPSPPRASAGPPRASAVVANEFCFSLHAAVLWVDCRLPLRRGP
jgi:hypothetical protein